MTLGHLPADIPLASPSAETNSHRSLSSTDMSNKRKQHDIIEVVEVDSSDGETIATKPPTSSPRSVNDVDIEDAIRDPTPLEARKRVLKLEDFAKTQFCAVKVD